MAVYMISYDLSEPCKNYEKVCESIEALGEWCHYLESTYLVKTSLSADDINSRIIKFLDASDRLITCEILRPVSGWLPEEQRNWINFNL
ncbi:hypothetical protein CDLVIII_3084 [Clostridium sp. DL-VIII]|uniref:hypothetical protein n=1 Tax=Clostridium sp. DL-VIII TaxID=641107 RepID=UPI00023AFE29|nr:hypothetical protein [Clostridium sp. DL-VIII]EHI99667.1 hypothetical protein CDLVIII_3084 [Clostridium sp. DL-VIII]